MFQSLTSKAIVAGIVLLFAFAGGWKLRDYQAKAHALTVANEALASLKTALVQKDLISTADAEKSRTLEEVIAAMRAGAAQVQIVREKEYVEKPVYRDCVLPPSGVQLLNGRVADRHPTADSRKR